MKDQGKTQKAPIVITKGPPLAADAPFTNPKKETSLKPNAPVTAKSANRHLVSTRSRYSPSVSAKL